LATEVDLFQ